MEHAPSELVRLADQAFSDDPANPLRETHALIASLNGEVVFERYAPPFDADSTFISWSMAKSVTSALCGVLAGQDRLDLDAPAPVPEWHRSPDDPRATITVRHLLQMRSGLAWAEDYVDAGISNVIEMLFGSGQGDTAAYAADRPLAHEPGAEWLYSSGTTNILTRILRDAIGGGPAGFTAALVDDLLRPAGMDHVTLKFDDAGTWIGSSFLYATARDFLAFGELYRNDGCVGSPGGRRLLPEGWVRDSVREHAICPETGQGYGLQWWLARDGHGSFCANGYEGQRIQVVPDLGLTFVRLGKTSADYGVNLREFYKQVAGCFA